MAASAILNFHKVQQFTPPTEVRLQNLAKYKQLRPETSHVTKTDTGSKFKMAAVAIFNSI